CTCRGHEGESPSWHETKETPSVLLSALPLLVRPTVSVCPSPHLQLQPHHAHAMGCSHPILHAQHPSSLHVPLQSTRPHTGTHLPCFPPHSFAGGAGWDMGILGMCVGEKRKLKIPSHMGYGESGSPPKIPGGATLIFETELVEIVGAKPADHEL
ncbi:unnamed protein product, partial [Closterium sp. NIES-53]